jgi:hypothetical protein
MNSSCSFTETKHSPSSPKDIALHEETKQESRKKDAFKRATIGGIRLPGFPLVPGSGSDSGDARFLKLRRVDKSVEYTSNHDDLKLCSSITVKPQPESKSSKKDHAKEEMKVGKAEESTSRPGKKSDTAENSSGLMLVMNNEAIQKIQARKSRIEHESKQTAPLDEQTKPPIRSPAAPLDEQTKSPIRSPTAPLDEKTKSPIHSPTASDHSDSYTLPSVFEKSHTKDALPSSVLSPKSKESSDGKPGKGLVTSPDLSIVQNSEIPEQRSKEQSDLVIVNEDHQSMTPSTSNPPCLESHVATDTVLLEQKIETTVSSLANETSPAQSPEACSLTAPVNSRVPVEAPDGVEIFVKNDLETKLSAQKELESNSSSKTGVVEFSCQKSSEIVISLSNRSSPTDFSLHSDFAATKSDHFSPPLSPKLELESRKVAYDEYTVSGGSPREEKAQIKVVATQPSDKQRKLAARKTRKSNKPRKGLDFSSGISRDEKTAESNSEDQSPVTPVPGRKDNECPEISSASSGKRDICGTKGHEHVDQSDNNDKKNDTTLLVASTDIHGQNISFRSESTCGEAIQKCKNQEIMPESEILPNENVIISESDLLSAYLDDVLVPDDLKRTEAVSLPSLVKERLNTDPSYLEFGESLDFPEKEQAYLTIENKTVEQTSISLDQKSPQGVDGTADLAQSLGKPSTDTTAPNDLERTQASPLLHTPSLVGERSNTDHNYLQFESSLVVSEKERLNVENKTAEQTPIPLGEESPRGIDGTTAAFAQSLGKSSTDATVVQGNVMRIEGIDANELEARENAPGSPNDSASFNFIKVEKTKMEITTPGKTRILSTTERETMSNLVDSHLAMEDGRFVKPTSGKALLHAKPNLEVHRRSIQNSSVTNVEKEESSASHLNEPNNASAASIEGKHGRVLDRWISDNAVILIIQKSVLSRL